MPVKGSSSSALERMQGKFVINIVTRCCEWQRSHSSQGRIRPSALKAAAGLITHTGLLGNL